MTRSGYTCIRRALCWMNVSLWLTGCGLVATGLWLRFGYEGYVSLLPQYALLSVDNISMIIGGIIIVYAFFGCCGSWFENRCLLITYFSFVILIFELEFFLGILAFIFRAQLINVIHAELQDSISHHYSLNASVPNNLVEIWDKVQTELKCCGVESCADWYRIDAWPTESWVPESCCITPVKGCGQTYTTSWWHRRGCVEQVQLWFAERLHIIGIIGLIVAFIQLFGLISSILLFCTEKKRRSSETYTSFSPND